MTGKTERMRTRAETRSVLLSKKFIWNTDFVGCLQVKAWTKDDEERCKACSTGLARKVADIVADALVASEAEITIKVAPKGDGKVGEGETRDDETIDDEVDEPPEDKHVGELVGALLHGIDRGRLETKGQCGRSGGEGVDPKCADRRDGEGRLSILIDKGQPNHHDQDFRQVAGEKVEQELLQIEEDTTTLADGCNDGSKVVVG